MFAKSNIRPRNNCNLGLEVQINCLLKKMTIKGKIIITVKKYLAHTICKTGKSALRYLAMPSIIGNMHQASKL